MPTTDTAGSTVCDSCGKLVRVRKDGTYGAHSYTQHRRPRRCDASGTPVAMHRCGFRVIERDPNGIGIMWLAECRCGLSKVAPTYEELNQWHRDHPEAVSSNGNPTAGRVTQPTDH